MPLQKNQQRLENIITEIEEIDFKSPIVPRRILIVVRKSFQGLLFCTAEINDSMLQKETQEYPISFEPLELDFFFTDRKWYNRCEIMDNILVLETLLSQIIFVVFNREKVNNKYDYSRVKFFDDDFNIKWDYILEKIDFGAKIRALEEQGIINKRKHRDESECLYKIMGVRNQVAHILNQNFIYLDRKKKDKLLANNLNEFQEYLKKTFKYLIDIYRDVWDPIDMAEFIKQEIYTRQK